MEIIVAPNALVESKERLFPESKNRSARIRKKLVKRFGGEFRKVPGAFRVGDRLVVHPVLYHQLQNAEELRPGPLDSFSVAGFTPFDNRQAIRRSPIGNIELAGLSIRKSNPVANCTP